MGMRGIRFASPLEKGIEGNLLLLLVLLGKNESKSPVAPFAKGGKTKAKLSSRT